MSDNSLSEKSDAQLDADREKAARELWAQDPKKRQELEAKLGQLERERNGPRGEDSKQAAEREKVAAELKEVREKHAQAEAKYNDVERERFARQGNNPADYKTKHDARHEFRYEENERTGEKRATMAEKPDGSGSYTLRKKDEVINWRDETEAGKSASKSAQTKAAGKSGDDAGHLIGAEFGADPADKRNLAKQELIQNESGPWYEQERQLRGDVEGGRQCGVDVSVKQYGDRSGRTMHTFDVSPDGKRSEPKNTKMLYADFSNESVRAHQGGPPGREAARDARSEAHARAAQNKSNLENQDPEAVREWREGRMRPVAGGPPPRGRTASPTAPPPRRSAPAPDEPPPSPDKGRSR